ncbi:unnamed protein product [Brassica rapa subsp. narinosa]|uniref:(rape) hypothetical protein n=1 Tax=Brassica napus TaxID=3708 RepID=A0A816K2N7_BRANA|nr:unnamed protein product [Brassica napus]
MEENVSRKGFLSSEKLSAAASPVKLSAAVSPVKLSGASLWEVLGLCAPGQALVPPASPVKPSATASPTNFFTTVSPLDYMLYKIFLFVNRVNNILTV